MIGDRGPFATTVRMIDALRAVITGSGAASVEGTLADPSHHVAALGRFVFARPTQSRACSCSVARCCLAPIDLSAHRDLRCGAVVFLPF